MRPISSRNADWNIKVLIVLCCISIGILHKFSLKDMGILNILLDILQGILYNLSHGNI